MKIVYSVKDGKLEEIGPILYCCDVMQEAIANRWIEIEKYSDSPEPELYFDTDGTWIGISKYCYNCGQKIEVKAK